VTSSAQTNGTRFHVAIVNPTTIKNRAEAVAAVALGSQVFNFWTPLERLGPWLTTSSAS
jgi:hypothetical protein